MYYIIYIIFNDCSNEPFNKIQKSFVTKAPTRRRSIVRNRRLSHSASAKVHSKSGHLPRANTSKSYKHKYRCSMLFL